MSRTFHAAVGYGIDQGDGFTAIARCARRGRRLEMLAVATDGAAPALREALAAAGDAQRRRRALVAAALPARDTLVRRIVVPLPSVAKARRVLPSLLDAQIPLSLDACAWAAPELRVNGGGQVVALAAIAPTETVSRRVEQLRGVGADPAVLVSEALALWRGSVAEAPPRAAAARVVVYAGRDRWTASAGVGAEFRWSAAGAPPANDLPEAAVAAAGFVLRRLRTEEGFRDSALEWRWCGPAVPKDAARAAIETAAASGGRRLEFSEHADAPGFLARALARLALDEGAPAGNLRDGALAAPDLVAWRARQAARGWLMLLAAGLVLIAVNVAGRVALERRADAAQAELAGLARAVAGAAPYGRELAAARAALDRRAEEFAPFEHALRSPATEALTAALDLAGENNLLLYEIQASDTRARISGEAPDRAAVEALTAALSAIGWQTTVEWEAASEGRAGFTVRGTRP